jgi:hypothetical protein
LSCDPESSAARWIPEIWYRNADASYDSNEVVTNKMKEMTMPPLEVASTNDRLIFVVTWDDTMKSKMNKTKRARLVEKGPWQINRYQWNKRNEGKRREAENLKKEREDRLTGDADVTMRSGVESKHKHGLSSRSRGQDDEDEDQRSAMWLRKSKAHAIGPWKHPTDATLGRGNYKLRMKILGLGFLF